MCADPRHLKKTIIYQSNLKKGFFFFFLELSKQGYPLVDDANRKRASSPKAGGKMPHLLGCTPDVSESMPLPSHSHYTLRTLATLTQ